MKRSIFVLMASALATSLHAGSVYHGFGSGSPDLYSGLPAGSGSSRATAVPPAIGGDFNRYQGIDRGNPDLFGPSRPTPRGDRGGPADVYHGIEKGHPDLQ
jgi:hypothetical protein